LPKSKINGLAAGEDGIIRCLFVLTQYRRVTDGQTDRIAVAKTAISIAAYCKSDDDDDNACIMHAQCMLMYANIR